MPEISTGAPGLTPKKKHYVINYWHHFWSKVAYYRLHVQTRLLMWLFKGNMEIYLFFIMFAEVWGWPIIIGNPPPHQKKTTNQTSPSFICSLSDTTRNQKSTKLKMNLLIEIVQSHLDCNSSNHRAFYTGLNNFIINCLFNCSDIFIFVHNKSNQSARNWWVLLQFFLFTFFRQFSATIILIL